MAPQRFAKWLTEHQHKDPLLGWVYHYHPRSDAHSVALCSFVLDDIVAECPILRDQAIARCVVFGINVKHTFPNGKTKTLDLAVGTPRWAPQATRPRAGAIVPGEIDRVLLACEVKTVMTEHSKSQPRIFDELSSSHEIVHQGDAEAIAAGITVVNAAQTFVSPLRQRGRSLYVTKHRQPRAAQRMVSHLRGLQIRDDVAGVGFDAYATILIDCDNQGPTRHWSEPPAPQPGDPDHYLTFLARMATSFAERFG